MMRTNLMTITLLAVTFFVSGCAGDAPESMSSSFDPAVVEQEVTEALEESWDALSRHDLEAYQSYTAPGWRLYTVMGNKISAERLLEIHSANITNFSIDMSNLEIHATGPVAWVTYDGTISALNQGEEWGGEFIFTTVFEQVDGEWKMVHKHESKKQ